MHEVQVVDVADRLIVITVETYEVMLSGKNPDIMSVYDFYYYTGKRQKTNRPKATVPYISKGLSISPQRVKKARKFLLEKGLIKDIKIKSKDGKVDACYVEIRYMIKNSTTSTEIHPVDNDASGETTSTICHPVENQTPNALRYSSSNAGRVTNSISTNVDIEEADASGVSDSDQIDDDIPTPSPSSADPLPRSVRKRTPEQVKLLDDLLDELRAYSEELVLVYDAKEERIFGVNILRATEFGTLAESLGKTRIELAKHIMRASKETPYIPGGVAAGPKDIYLRRSPVINAYHKRSKNSDGSEQRERTFREGHCSPDVVNWVFGLPIQERFDLAKHLNQKNKTFGGRQDDRFKEARIKEIYNHLKSQQSAA